MVSTEKSEDLAIDTKPWAGEHRAELNRGITEVLGRDRVK
jgi:hypothetical protein